MPIIRVNKNKDNPYLIMNKTGLNDKNLSLKAKGLLCYFLSLPDDWKIYENELVNHHKDGRDSIRSSIKELIDNGYIERKRLRSDKGYLGGYEYIVYEIPKNGKSNVGKTNNGESNTTNYLSKLNNNKLTNESKGKGVQHKVSLYTVLKDKKDLDKEVIEVVRYYLEVYSDYFDKELKYTVEEWNDIFEDILCSDAIGDLEGCVDTIEKAIDKHFKTEYNHKQMYLLHNFKGTTKDNRLYESGIL